MSWTKGEIVNDLFGELALASYVFDITPEEEQAALRKVDTMMAEWSASGINLGYAFGLTPSDSSLDQDSGLPLFAISAVVLNGAIRFAAGKGKALAASTKASAKAAYDAMLIPLAHADLQAVQLPNTVPLGAGSKPWRTFNSPFVTTPDTSPLTIGADGGLVFNGN